MPMGKGFAITSNLSLGKLLLAGFERHVDKSVTNGDDPGSPSPAKRRKIRRIPRLKIAAITNDTVATLASLAYTIKSEPHSRVAMGLIVGTGSNATIPMKLGALHESKQSLITVPQGSMKDLKDVEVVVNTEWTIKGAAGPLKAITTKWDKILDDNCDLPGFQPFEYMTSGRYLGELVRLIVVDLLQTIFRVRDHELPVILQSRNSLTTQFLATSIATSGSGSVLVPRLIAQFPVPDSSGWNWTIDAAEAVRKAAVLVQVRAAGLIAAATIGLLGCKGELQLLEDGAQAEIEPLTPTANGTIAKILPEELVIAYTGGVIDKYPRMLMTCQNYIDDLLAREKASRGANRSLLNESRTVVLQAARDGGIIGAGVLAGTDWTAK
jgi:hexokinase